jgi:hypothetical protein
MEAGARDDRGPAQNRVTPMGDIIAAAGRGAWMGNRGRLHDGTGSRQVRRHHQSRAWITCVLDFKSRRVAHWDPHRYTPLFFLDEAVAFAAGHRPCAECRRSDFVTFRDAVARSLGVAHLSAPDLDRQLHDERWDPERRTRRLYDIPWANLPEGAFVLLDAGPALVHHDHLRLWQRDNTYGAQLARPASGVAAVITPPSALAVLRGGYPVQLGDRAYARPRSSSE